jgi:hypothetical protein
LIGATLDNEDVAVRCAEQESRIAKSSSVQFDFEPRRNFGLRVSWPVYNVRPINCESIRTRWRQILHRDFAHDSRRIACPIAHCGFAGEDRVFFSGGGDCDGDDENRCDPGVEENTSNSAIPHCFLESPLVCRLRGLLRARVARSCSGEHTLPVCMSRQFAKNRELVGIRATKKSFFRELSAGRDSAAKFAIARTRSPAREPRALPRTCSAALVFLTNGAIENA